ncbi:DNA binding protein DnaJ, heat shock protein [Legionella moravica]|uniref:Co-chaperone protein DjlA n=1 Tax=Legionella moravica TaxID=39962 RepID=A0A378JTI7_9GAMM|nr:co-chaperone DjlA [Legionella moravica]KTD39225.1 DNA binding protein DnaJ, heat shock protein [Legionella moravica]STX61766.1 DNA binding protein DnaJ, heat shock protein [Legionella moravica]
MTFREFFTLSTWWGKLLGAFFGFLSAGPIGALFGILVGNFFDRGLASHYSNPHWYYHSEKRKAVQKAFFETTFSVMGHIAKADGRVTEQEISMAKLLMKEMRLNSEQIERAKRLFNEGKNKQFKLETALFELKKICRDNRDLLKLFVDIQYRAAQVDGLTTAKIKVLDVVFACLGFAPLHRQYRFYDDFKYSSYAQQQQEQTQQQNNQQHQYNEYSHNYSSQKQYQYKQQSSQNNLAHAYALLEVNPNSTKQEVKRSYRRLLSRNHPDKLIAQGLPEEMIKLANDKTHKIMKAYELICQNKGW